MSGSELGVLFAFVLGVNVQIRTTRGFGGSRQTAQKKRVITFDCELAPNRTVAAMQIGGFPVMDRLTAHESMNTCLPTTNSI
jgi:hypothetical protein